MVQTCLLHEASSTRTPFLLKLHTHWSAGLSRVLVCGQAGVWKGDAGSERSEHVGEACHSDLSSWGPHSTLSTTGISPEVTQHGRNAAVDWPSPRSIYPPVCRNTPVRGFDGVSDPIPTPPNKRFSDISRCPTIQVSSNTVYLETTPDPTGKELSPQDCPLPQHIHTFQRPDASSGSSLCF